MPQIGNTLGRLSYIDLPITAAASNVQFTVPTTAVAGTSFIGPVDLVGVEVLAKGVTATALKVNSSTVAAGAIASLTNNFGSAHATAPTPGVPVGASGGTGAAPQNNQTAVGNLNWASSGAIQGFYTTDGVGFTNRSGAVPAAGALTPLSAAIPAGQVVEVDFTGSPAIIASLPKPDANGNIFLPTKGSSIQGFGGWVSADGYLSSALSTGAPITSLPVSALPFGLSNGQTVTVTSGANTQTWTLTADAAAGATTLAVTSQTPNFAYPAGTPVNLTTLLPADGVAFQVKATDTLLDTFAGQVRLWFQIPVSDPNTAAKAAGTYPNNGVQKGSAGIY